MEIRLIFDLSYFDYQLIEAKELLFWIKCISFYFCELILLLKINLF
jgi:hypothetical protein